MITPVLLYPLSCAAWSSRLSTTFSGVSLPQRILLSRSRTRRWASSTERPEGTKIAATAPNLLLGGDFAGYSAEFNPTTGAIKPVPVYLVPPSLLEWGQHPTSLESIVSEDFCEEPCEHDSDVHLLDRVCLSVLPETGCGVDNLEVQKATEMGWKILKMNENIVGLVRSKNPTEISLEAVFGHTEEDHRIRISVALSKQLSLKAIGMSIERRFSATSTNGSRADGGGLDGASVSRWIGTGAAKEGNKIFESSIMDEGTDKNDQSTIVLPLNATVQFTSGEDSILRICHADNEVAFKLTTGDVDSIQIV